MATWLPTVVDRIHMTVTLPSGDLYAAVLSQLYGMQDESKVLVPMGKITVVKEQYLTRLNYCPVHTRRIAELHLGTTKSQTRYFKLVLYPERFKPGEFLRFQEILAAFLDEFSYSKLYQSSNVSYLEIAADVLFRPDKSFIPIGRQINRSHVYVGKKGVLGTVYLGSPNSSKRFCIYNKAKKLTEMGADPKFHTRTRIEARLRKTKLSPVELVDNLKNPFDSLEIADLEAAKGGLDEPGWPQFLERCVQVGSAQALAKCVKKQRKQYVTALSAAKVNWWSASFVWGGWAKALEAIEPA